MNIDFLFASEADTRSDAHKHARIHIYTLTCTRPQPKRMSLRSPIFVPPPAWEMRLLSKSWWIFSRNSKSKPHFASPPSLWAPFMSAIPPSSHSHHSLTKWQHKKRNIALDSYLHLVMNGSTERTAHIRSFNMLFSLTAYLILLRTTWSYSLYLPPVAFTCMLLLNSCLTWVYLSVFFLFFF